jgi:hypothetical protein
VEDRINGGAVREDKSPLNEAIDCGFGEKNGQQEQRKLAIKGIKRSYL